MSRAAVERRRPGRVVDVQQAEQQRRRRRAWVLIVGAPLAVFLSAYLCAGGPALSWWPLLAAGGLVVVFGTVSVLVRLLLHQEARNR